MVGSIRKTYFGIALSIFQQIKYKPGRFYWPTTLSIGVPVLGLCSSPDTTTESSKWNCLFVGQNILKVSLGLCQRQLPDGKCSFPCVLKSKQV